MAVRETVQQKDVVVFTLCVAEAYKRNVGRFCWPLITVVGPYGLHGVNARRFVS